jgi:hypothetical protein
MWSGNELGGLLLTAHDVPEREQHIEKGGQNLVLLN